LPEEIVEVSIYFHRRSLQFAALTLCCCNHRSGVEIEEIFDELVRVLSLDSEWGKRVDREVSICALQRARKAPESASHIKKSRRGAG